MFVEILTSTAVHATGTPDHKLLDDVAEGEWATIVSAKMARAPARIAAAMGAVGEMVGRRHRITVDANGPNEISTSWFPPEIVLEAPRC